MDSGGYIITLISNNLTELFFITEDNSVFFFISNYLYKNFTMKKIRIREKQIYEALDVFVNKKGNENAEQALKRTQKETEQQVGGNKEVNYVVSSNEIKESNVFTKSQILEARRNYLKNNSKQFTKETFLKK